MLPPTDGDTGTPVPVPTAATLKAIKPARTPPMYQLSDQDPSSLESMPPVMENDPSAPVFPIGLPVVVLPLCVTFTVTGVFGGPKTRMVYVSPGWSVPP